MHGLVYEYQVDPAHVAGFQEVYEPDGQSARFFRSGAGYLGTELFRDSTEPGRYLVIDRWVSAEAPARFLAERGQEYQRHSRDSAHLHLREVRLGAFDTVAAD
jgi:heme-degrading monooxygenase HmoA